MALDYLWHPVLGHLLPAPDAFRGSSLACPELSDGSSMRAEGQNRKQANDRDGLHVAVYVLGYSSLDLGDHPASQMGQESLQGIEYCQSKNHTMPCGQASLYNPLRWLIAIHRW